MPKTAKVRLDLRASADFRIIVPDRRETVVQGTNATYLVEADALTGYVDQESLDVTGLAEGVGFSFGKNPLVGDDSTTLTIDSTNLSAGTHYFDVGPATPTDEFSWLYVDNSDRLYPWPEYCGVPGGIPARATIYTTLGSAGQTPSYVQSVTATQISNAIAACPSEQTVYLNQGTYNIGNWTWNRKNGATLRGAGPGKTTLRPTAGGSFIESGYPMFVSPGIAISSGYAKGSMSIVLASAPTTYYRAGHNIMLAETTDKDKWGTNIGVYVGSECTAETSIVGVTNSKFTYFTRITSVVGNTINLASPIPVSFKAGNNPTAYAPDSTADQASMCGIENMTLDGAATGSSYAAINYRYADRMWLKDVEIKNFSGGDNGLIANYATFQCEYRRLYIHDCQGFPTQGDGQGIGLEWSPSNVLIVDCIANNVASLYQGVGENVCALVYNYCGTMARDGIVVGNGWLNGGISHHGPESLMGLYEGNVFNSWALDGYHGSGAWQTLFRNHINGLTPGYSTPYERKMIHLLRGSYYINVIGNVLGDASWTMERYEATTSSGENCAYVIGFPNASGVSLTPAVSWPMYTNTLPDPNVLATLLRNANYDYYNHAVVYASGLGHDVPVSLFYSSKPSWFGSLAWPAIGPDVGGYITDIPAQRRWKTYQSSGILDDLFTDVS